MPYSELTVVSEHRMSTSAMTEQVPKELACVWEEDIDHLMHSRQENGAFIPVCKSHQF